MTPLEDYLLDLRSRRRMLIRQCQKQGDVRGAGLLLQWKDIRCCCSPGLHRKEFYHAGQQCYVCAVCERIAV